MAFWSAKADSKELSEGNEMGARGRRPLGVICLSDHQSAGVCKSDAVAEAAMTPVA